MKTPLDTVRDIDAKIQITSKRYLELDKKKRTDETRFDMAIYSSQIEVLESVKKRYLTINAKQIAEKQQLQLQLGI